MTERRERDALARAIEASIDGARGAERYERQQREARRGSRNGNGNGVARPLEFDESGFPIPQRGATFIERLTRRRSSS